VRLVDTSEDLVQLRQHLARARAEGQPWEAAWGVATAGLMAPLGDWHATQLQRVLTGTEQAWRRAYERTPSTELDSCALRLQEFAAYPDAELTYAGPGR
jgi:hypothetical protein